MNLIQKGHRHTHRGIIGVESAIVLIAFVIVAAALAFVVLNMGFSTTQKAKTTIVSTLAEAGSSLEVEGKVIGSAYIPGGGLPSGINATSVPIKIAGGGDSINLDPAFTAIKYLSNQITYDNIYNGTLNALAKSTYNSLNASSIAAATYDTAIGGKIVSKSPFIGGCVAPVPPCDPTEPNNNDWPFETTAYIYWTVQANTNDILEAGEHANLAIIFAKTDLPAELDKIRIELIVSSGAALTIERNIPNITTSVVDLG